MVKLKFFEKIHYFVQTEVLLLLFTQQYLCGLFYRYINIAINNIVKLVCFYIIYVRNQTILRFLNLLQHLSLGS